MDFSAVFKLLSENFARERIDFAVIGGFALQAAGVARATMDIDLLVGSNDSGKVRQIMKENGFKLIHESEDVMNFCGANPDLGRVDFLLAHREYATAMLKRAKKTGILSGQFNIKSIAVEDQIGLKVQSSSNDPRRRQQDIADIEALIRKHYSDLDVQLIKEYFRLFNREEELDKIIRNLRNA